ncbi:Uma2 family endonuclease [soil metagenome]
MPADLVPDVSQPSYPNENLPMSTAPRRKLTAKEYLEIEERAETRSEFFNGEMFAMSGGSVAHSRIKENLVIEIGSRLKGGKCQTHSSDLRVLVDATGLYTYPDIIILCGPGVYDPANRNTLTNPTAIVEVLSPSTERYDRGTKFRNYQQIPSLSEYILVAQDEAVCERFVRQADGSWALISFVGLTATMELTSVPVRVPLADIYAGVTFPETPPQ